MWQRKPRKSREYIARGVRLVLLRRDLQQDVATSWQICDLQWTQSDSVLRQVDMGRTLLPLLSVLAISRADSILRNCTRPSPADESALEMIVAASASPSARTTLAWRSCSDRSTMNFARSASCCATCFASTASVNSLPNVMCVCGVVCLDISRLCRLRTRRRTHD